MQISTNVTPFPICAWVGNVRTVSDRLLANAHRDRPGIPALISATIEMSAWMKIFVKMAFVGIQLEDIIVCVIRVSFRAKIGRIVSVSSVY